MIDTFLLFYTQVLQHFVQLNLQLQRDEPIIAIVDEQLSCTAGNNVNRKQILGNKYCCNCSNACCVVVDVKVHSCNSSEECEIS